MARYGAKYIRWAPFDSENAEVVGTLLPKYGTVLSLSELQKISDNPTYAEGKQHGDNGLAEYVREFTEADVDVEITDLPVAHEQAILGAKEVASGDLKLTRFGASDVAPYGALGAISCIQRNNVKKYQAIFYPKVKAAMQGEEYVTKGENITLAGGKLKFKAMACGTSDWKLKSDYLDSEDAAKEYIDDLFSGAITLVEAES